LPLDVSIAPAAIGSTRTRVVGYDKGHIAIGRDPDPTGASIVHSLPIQLRSIVSLDLLSSLAESVE
jgi:hypothetical protein